MCVYVDSNKIAKSMELLYSAINVYCVAFRLKLPEFKCGKWHLENLSEEHQNGIKEIITNWANIPLEDKVNAFDSINTKS